MWSKKAEEIKELRPFIYINNTRINQTSIFNLIIEKYKKNYSYEYKCRKNVSVN